MKFTFSFFCNKKSNVSRKRQKNEHFVTTHLKALREPISTRVDTSATFNLEYDNGLTRGL